MKKRIITIVIGLVALVGAFIGAKLYQNNYLSGVSMVKMPVPLVDIPPYTVLTADMFVLQEFPSALAEIQPMSGASMEESIYVLITGELEGA